MAASGAANFFLYIGMCFWGALNKSPPSATGRVKDNPSVCRYTVLLPRKGAAGHPQHGTTCPQTHFQISMQLAGFYFRLYGVEH